MKFWKNINICRSKQIVDNNSFDIIMKNINNIEKHQSNIRSNGKYYGDNEHLLRVIKLLARKFQSELMQKLYLSDSDNLGGVKV